MFDSKEIIEFLMERLKKEQIVKAIRRDVKARMEGSKIKSNMLHKVLCTN